MWRTETFITVDAAALEHSQTVFLMMNLEDQITQQFYCFIYSREMQVHAYTESWIS